jgi:hypothetical protein
MLSALSGSGGRRPRGQVPRGHVIKAKLSAAEKAAVTAAAARAGLAPGAFIAQAAVDVAEDQVVPDAAVRRKLLAELTRAADLVHRAGVNLNQAVTRLNATGQPGHDLGPSAEFCMRAVRRVDEAARLLIRRGLR